MGLFFLQSSIAVTRPPCNNKYVGSNPAATINEKNRHWEGPLQMEDQRSGQDLSGYTPPGRDLYCSPCRLYGPTYRSSPHIPLEEVMWQPGEEVYSDNLLRRLCE